MKKILAVLVAVVMVVSSFATMAFAATAPTSWVNISKDASDNYFQFATTITVAVDEKIKIVVQSPDGAILNSSSIRTGDKDKYTKETVELKDLGNGWYELSTTATTAGIVMVRLYFGEYTDKIAAEVSANVAEISVGDTSYKFASDADITAAGIEKWTGMEPVCKIVTGQVTGGDVTEDVTEGTEDTGVVSVAVVAVAAVVGGAVVLKKREF